MRRFGFISLTAVLAAGSLTMAGCCQKEKQQIAELHAQYNELSARNKDLQSKLAQAKAREMELESQAAQVGAKEGQLAEKDREIALLQAKIKDQATMDVPSQTGQWDVGKYADKISVGTDILFASGRATLTSGGKAALERIVHDLRSTYAGLPVRVYGYTDSDPIKKTKDLWHDNLDLSANRTMAVTRHLAGKGIAAANVETVAMGSTHYVARNDTRAAKAKNRRVEIVVIKR